MSLGVFQNLKAPVRYWEDDAQFRSSRLQMFFKIGVLKNSTNFTGKHLRPATFLKRDSNTGVFSKNFVKFLRAPFFTEHLW